MALLQATKESIWINRFLQKLERSPRNRRLIYKDNQGAIALAHNSEYHGRTKQIDIQYHFIRVCMEIGIIKLEYCPIKDKVADALTKPLTKERHWELISKMKMETSKQFQSRSIEIIGTSLK
jgi:hypothetical protein